MISYIALKYSNENFKDILSAATTICDDKKKMDLKPFPGIGELAIFAEKAYSKEEDVEPLPEGWKLLTTASGGWNGYVGYAFCNSSLQQVVLSHCGTVFWNVGSVFADIKGAWQTKYTAHMSSAVSFGDEIKRVILDVNKKEGVRFTLTITGHSLGGWLAQITAITTKHLKRQNKGFTPGSNISEGIHAHTVVFDSPGVQDMAIKIQRDYFERCGSNPFSMFRSLDITAYFLAANFVNGTGFHVGSVYQVSSNRVCTSDFKHIFSNLSTHGIKNFIDAFRAGNVKLFLVKDWPQGWTERELVHELEQDQQTHRPQTESGQSVHYEIEEDPGMSVKLHCFSKVELEFIKLMNIVRNNEIPHSNIESFFSNKSLSLEDLFPNFTISRKEETVVLNSKQNLEKFVNNIKNAMRWFSCELQDVMEEQKKLTTPSFLLDIISLDSIPVLPACEDVVGLSEFIENTASMLYIQAADCSLEMARISNILYQLDESYADTNRCMFLDLEGLLKLNKKLFAKSLPLTNDRLNLFIIIVGSITEITDAVKEVLEKIFLKFNIKKKVVIVSHKNSVLYDLVKSFESRLAICFFPLSKEECIEFKIKDLKDFFRRELFSRLFIVLQEREMSLNTLLGENCQSLDLLVSMDDVLKPFLKDLLMEENYVLNISNNQPKFVKSDVMYLKINREVFPDSFTELLREKESFLFVSSGVRQLLEPQLREVLGAAERVLDIIGSSEEDFRQACLENPSVNIAYWLTAADGRLYLKQVYNKSFYLSRQFHHQSVVDLEKLVQKENAADLFIFVGVVNKATLMNDLNASFEVEKLFYDNLKFQIKDSGEKAKGIDQCVNKHTLRVVREGESNLLLWQDSKGTHNSLLPCLRTDSRLLGEEDLCVLKAVIISDQPGMGKSTTLTSLSRYLNDSWQLRMDLRDRRADITNLPAQMSVESVAHFLAGADSEPAARGLLRFCLQSRDSRQIHVLLDGFDEIREEGAIEKVLKLCHFLKNETTAKIIVTTRDSYKDALINRLSIFPTIFEEINEENQLNFLVNYWHSYAVLGAGSSRERRDERLRQFAQDLYKAAHKKVGGEIISLIGIPLHMTILAQAFLQQAEEYCKNTESNPVIIGINNVYNLYKKFTGVKRDIYLTEKIVMGADMISGIDNILCEKITENHCILAFHILDAEFAMKYLQVAISEDEFKEMNRFGLTQWNRETHCDFIHRTFAEYFCSEFLVLWLRRENFRFKYLPMEEWFLSNLLINKDFNIVRKFLDEHIAENPLTSDSKLLFNFMSTRWIENEEAFRDKDGQTALHVAVKENNPNIIDFLLSGLGTEQTREAFISFLIARDCEGFTALKRGLIILYPKNYNPESPIDNNSENCSKEDIVKRIMQNISHLPYEFKFKILLHTILENEVFRNEFKFLLECTLNEVDREDIQAALDRIEILEKYILYLIEQVRRNNTSSIRDFIFNELENDVERKFLPFVRIEKHETAFDIASGAGNLEMVKLFIEGNSDVLKSRYSFGMTPLHWAVAGGHIDVVDYLLDQGARLDVVDSKGKTALSLASECGHLLIVKCLLKRGALVNLLDADGRTALHIAIKKPHLIIVKHLLESGANVNSMDVRGDSVIHLAAKSADWLGIVFIKHLLKYGADVNLKGNIGRTALSCAACTSVEVSQYLIKCGSDVNTSDHHGRTPLLIAILARGSWKSIQDKYDEVDCLLASGADVNWKDLSGRNALSFAAEEGMVEIVKKIHISYGGDINTSDQHDKTALMYAVSGIENDNMVEYLVKSGAEINSCDKDGKTPLIYAILKFGNESVIKYLIESGAVINTPDQDGKTPLMYVISEMGNSKNMVNYFFEAGAEVNTPDKDGKTPLIYAILKYRNDDRNNLIEYLVEVGAELNTRCKVGKTPLIYAILEYRNDAVEFLVESGAEVNTGGLNDDILFYAALTNNEAMVEYLLKSGADVSSDRYGEKGLYSQLPDVSKKVKQIIDKYAAAKQKLEEHLETIPTKEADA